jgi:hypothetical protein
MQYLGFDVHKKYTFFTQMDASAPNCRVGFKYAAAVDDLLQAVRPTLLRCYPRG